MMRDGRVRYAATAGGCATTWLGFGLGLRLELGWRSGIDKL
jgi:hypothetical protein